ncbi:PAS domain S-box protein [Roseomonas sp. WA12]
MPDDGRTMKPQQVLADFGEFALRSQDLDKVLGEACRLVGEATGTKRAKILEIRDEGKVLLVRAGVGWDPGVVGRVLIPMDEHSSETFAIKAGQPVVTQDISKEGRFGIPAFMSEAGVVALVNVPIFVPGGRAYGLLQVDATEPRDFGDDEIQFLRTYATILGPVIDRLLMESTLRSTEERFRLTVEAALDYAIYLTDPQDLITDWLPGAEAVFGWTAEEAVGQPSSLIFTREDRDKGQDRWEIETARREGVAPDVRWHVCKNGEGVFIEGSTRALRNADGTLTGFLKIGQDVTQRRAAEERLRGSEGRLRALLSATSHVTYRMNPDWSELLQLDGRGFLADTPVPSEAWWSEYMLADDQPQVRTAIEEAIRTKEPFDQEHRIRQADGRVGWAHSRAVPLLQEDGQIREWFGAASDISARKRAETALAESEERFRQFAEASSDLIWIRNSDTMELEYLSPAFEAIYGKSREAFLSGDTFQNWADLVVSEDREGALSGLECVRAGERAFNAFRISRPSDGEIRWIENTDFPLFDGQERVRRIAGFAKDVTEVRRGAARLEVLVAELQHRSRNLLGIVASLANKTLDEGKSTKAFQARLQALSRAQGLLSQFGSDTAEVGALVRMELEAHTAIRTPKVVVSGPEVNLTIRQVQNFSLAVHELTTNAVKYGALRDDAGQLFVTWTVAQDKKGQRSLMLDWVESGVVVQPDKVTRRGYGRQMIEKSLTYALGATTDFVLGEDGVRCRIQLPLE